MVDVVNACTNPGEWLAGWQGLVLIALVISYLLVSLYYMVGKMLSAPALEAKAKNEFYQTVMTSVMAVFLVGLVPSLCAFDLQGAGLSKSGNTFEIASFYAEWVAHKTMGVLSQIILWNHILSISTSIGMGVEIYGIGVSNTPFSGLAPLSNVLNILMSSTMIAVVVSFAQFVLLKFIYAGMFNILLPVGIVCRAFPFTREFGGALIAIAVGFFVFYPLLLNIDFVLIGQPEDFSDEGADLASTNLIRFVEDVGIYAAGVMASLFLGVGPLSIVIGISELLWILYRIIEIQIEFVTAGVATIFIGAFLLPAINGVVLVSVVRDLSKLLGSEVDISTLTRMI